MAHRTILVTRTAAALLVWAGAALLASPLVAQEPALPVETASAEDPVETPKRTYPALRLGGELELEYVDVRVERDSPADATAFPAGRFQVDFAALEVTAFLAKDVFGRFEARFRPAEPVDLQEAILRVEGLPLQGFVQAGWDSRIVKPGRKTEAYPLAGTAFWKGKTLGLGFGLEASLFESRSATADGSKGKRVHALAAVFEASLCNAMPLGKRPIGEDPSFRVLGYDESNLAMEEGLEVSLLAGLEGVVFGALRFDVAAFAAASRLSVEDRQVLWDLPGYGSWESRDQHFYGYSARARFAGATLFAHLCRGRLGRLGRAAWFVQGSYDLATGGFEALGARWLRSVEPLLRYGALDLDMVPDVSDSLTWDRRRITAALLVGLVKNVTLKFEYSWNLEDTGGGSVSNDEFVTQLELRF